MIACLVGIFSGGVLIGVILAALYFEHQNEAERRMIQVERENIKARIEDARRQHKPRAHLYATQEYLTRRALELGA